MRKDIRNRTIIIILVSLVGLYLVFMPSVKERWPNGKDFTSWTRVKENLANNINLGLDLRGGSHLVMQVQTNDVIKGITTKNVEAAEAKLKEKGWDYEKIEATGVDEITVTLPDRSRAADIINELDRDFDSQTPEGTGWDGTERGNTVVFKFAEDVQNRER